MYRTHSGVTEYVTKPAVVLHNINLFEDVPSINYILIRDNIAKPKFEDVLEDKDDESCSEIDDEDVETEMGKLVLALLKPDQVKVVRPKILKTIKLKSKEVSVEKVKKDMVDTVNNGPKSVIIDIDDADDDNEVELKLTKVTVTRPKLLQRRIIENWKIEKCAASSDSGVGDSVSGLDVVANNSESDSQLVKDGAYYKVLKKCKFVKFGDFA